MSENVKPMTNLISYFNQPVRILAICFLALALTIGAISTIKGEKPWSNIATELGSLAITVLLIDKLYEDKRKKEKKESLIDQMGSKVNDAALEAVRLLEKNGWLSDGSLRGGMFDEANLKGAHLLRANLMGTHLGYSNLENACIGGANFKRAWMTDANLRGASSMPRTVIQEVSEDWNDIYRANFEKAYLWCAILEEVKLPFANFEGAVL